MIDVAAHTVVVFSDLLDPFAHVAVHRLWTTRAQLGLDDTVTFEHHAFPLELFNGPGTRIGSDSEIPAVGALEPDAGWQLWNSADWHYPNTVLLAFEAVHAARAESAKASETLDRALRHAFWADSRCIGHMNVILDVAGACGVDAAGIEAALRDGRARRHLFADYVAAQSDDVSVSPQLFLADGTSYTNPGITVHWHGEWAKGFPVIDADDPAIYRHILRTAATPPPPSPALP